MGSQRLVGWRGAVWLGLFMAAVGCETRAPVVPASPPSLPTVKLEPPPPVDPAPAAESVEDAASAAGFLGRLCEAAENHDTSFVTAHTDLPPLGHQVMESEGQLEVSGINTLDAMEHMRQWAMCKHPLSPGASLEAFQLEGHEARGFAMLGGHRYRLTFERNPPRLIEQSYVLPEASLPARAPTERELVVGADVRSDYGVIDGELARRFHGYLITHPNCIEAQVQRELVGVSMLVTVRTMPGKDPVVRLYASTVAPVAFMACLEAQLAPTLSEIVREEEGPALHKLWGMVGITVSADEIGDDDAVIMMSP